MLTKKTRKILSQAEPYGWVLEPDAKRILSAAGADVPRFELATGSEAALSFAHAIGYPVVAKVVSPRVIHKSEHDGVAVGIANDRDLKRAFKRFSGIQDFAGMLVEEMLSGIELIIGAKNDFQFGPVVLLGIGGTGVEIYQDVSVRMAPLEAKDVTSMLKGLRAYEMLTGYRGQAAIDLEALKKLLLNFSDLIMDLEDAFESIDLNPVICSGNRCSVADARIMLAPAA